MDWLTILTAAASIAGIVTLVYTVFAGQRSIWELGRDAKPDATSVPVKLEPIDAAIDPPASNSFGLLPQPTPDVCRDLIQVASSSSIIALRSRLVTNTRIKPSVPYREFVPFEPSDFDLLSGRQRDIDEVVGTLTRTSVPERMRVIHGPSGIGKTSLLQAGITPALLKLDNVLPVYVRPWYDRDYQSPSIAIFNELLRYAPNAYDLTPCCDIIDLHTLLDLVMRQQNISLLVVLLDQAEEMFIHLDKATRQRFFNDLIACYADESLPVRFVISIRGDYFGDLYSEFLENPRINKHDKLSLRLKSLSAEQLSEAITKPALMFGVSFEPEVVATIINDFSSNSEDSSFAGLPYLQLVCNRLFEEAKSTKVIDSALYERMGGVSEIVRTHIDHVLSELHSHSKYSALEVLRMMVDRSGINRRATTFEELERRLGRRKAHLSDVLEHLIKYRLVRTAGEGGTGSTRATTAYELAHESIAGAISSYEAEYERDLRSRDFRRIVRGFAALLMDRAGDIVDAVPPRVIGAISVAAVTALVVIVALSLVNEVTRSRFALQSVNLPFGDEVYAISYASPDAPGRVYAVTCTVQVGCSVSVSEDSGAAWHRVETSIVPGVPTVLVGHPNNSDELWLGTYGDGIFVSTDGGASFAPRSTGLSSFVIKDIEFDPGDPTIVYAATERTGAIGGIFRTIDGGNTWRALEAELSGRTILDLAMVDTRTLYAAVFGAGVYRCDLNVTPECVPLAEKLRFADPVEIAYSPADSILYVATEANGVHRSSDRGVTWERLSTPTNYSYGFAVDGEGTIYLATFGSGGSIIWSSATQGEDWQAPAEGRFRSSVKVLAVAPVPQSGAIAGTQAGAFRTTNKGRSWSYSSVGSTPLGITEIAVAQSQEGLLYVASINGLVFRSEDSGGNWTSSLRGLDAPWVRKLVVDERNSSLVYAGTYRPNLPDSLLVSEDAADSWLAVNVRNDDLRDLKIDSVNPYRVYAAAYGTGVLVSLDGGHSWTNTGMLSDPWVQTLAVSTRNPEHLLAGTSSGTLYESWDAARTWQMILTPKVAIRQIAFFPDRDDLAVAATRRGAMVISNSQDSGWVAATTLDNIPVQSIIVDPCQSTVVYAGSTSGGELYWSNDSGGTWQRVNTPGVGSISSLAFGPGCPADLYLTSVTDGLWLLDRHSLLDQGLPN